MTQLRAGLQALQALPAPGTDDWRHVSQATVARDTACGLQVNKRSAHVPLSANVEVESAVEAVQNIGRTLDKSSQSPNKKVLDGFWDFQLFDSPADVPNGFWQPDAHLQGWGQVRAVPELCTHILLGLTVPTRHSLKTPPQGLPLACRSKSPAIGRCRGTGSPSTPTSSTPSL